MSRRFDHSFFSISSAEAFHVSPNVQLSMEIAFESSENTHIRSDMGVFKFVAVGMDEGYLKLFFVDKGWGGFKFVPTFQASYARHLTSSFQAYTEPVLLQAPLVAGLVSEL